MVITDGENFGKELIIGEGKSAEDFYELTENEYKDYLESLNKDD